MAGGFTGFENTKSTEIFTTGATAWTTVVALPSPGCEFRATNLNNVVYLLGKYHVKAVTRSQSQYVVFRWRYGDIEV